jgi:glycine reductase
MDHRVVLYVNQFFAGLGGEDKAGLGPEVLEKTPGPAVLLQQLLGERGQVVATVACGDNFVAENSGSALPSIAELIMSFEPTLVVAGPAFASGRYGMACAGVVSSMFDAGVAAVTGLNEENPAVGALNEGIYALSVAPSAAGMRDAMERLTEFGLRLAEGDEIGGPAEEGYFPRGIRRNVMSEKTAAERAVELLIKKLRGEPYESEIPLPQYDRVPPTQVSGPLESLTIAIVSEAGVVPVGNPDRLESARATHWYTYAIDDHDALDREEYQTVHGGFDNANMNDDPNRGVPLDALRELEREGAFGRLHDHYYATTGMTMPIAEAERIGAEIAASLRKNKIHAALITST